LANPQEGKVLDSCWQPVNQAPFSANRRNPPALNERPGRLQGVGAQLPGDQQNG
jgi:hypothetical protein